MVERAQAVRGSRAEELVIEDVVDRILKKSSIFLVVVLVEQVGFIIGLRRREPGLHDGTRRWRRDERMTAGATDVVTTVCST